MRKLSEMISRIRRLVQDVDSVEWQDSDAKLVIAEACNTAGRDLLRMPGRRVLRKIGDETDFVVDQEIYELPNDCLRLEQIEFSKQDSDDRWFPVARRDPTLSDKQIIHRGTSNILNASNLAITNVCWFDNTDIDSIRLWPAFSAVNEEKFRFRYYHKILIPTEDDGTLNDPDNNGTDIYNLPDLTATAIEYLAASMISQEDLQNPAPIQSYYQQYASVIRQIAVTGNRTRPKRQYIGTGKI